MVVRPGHRLEIDAPDGQLVEVLIGRLEMASSAGIHCTTALNLTCGDLVGLASDLLAAEGAENESIPPITIELKNGKNGYPGSSGSPGESGAYGRPGKNGSDGKDGSDGFNIAYDRAFYFAALNGTLCINVEGGNGGAGGDGGNGGNGGRATSSDSFGGNGGDGGRIHVTYGDWFGGPRIRAVLDCCREGAGGSGGAGGEGGTAVSYSSRRGQNGTAGRPGEAGSSGQLPTLFLKQESP